MAHLLRTFAALGDKAQNPYGFGVGPRRPRGRGQGAAQGPAVLQP